MKFLPSQCFVDGGEDLIMKTKHPNYQIYLDTLNGVPLIVLHGLWGNLTVWYPAVEMLRKEYRVIIPRLPLCESSLSGYSLQRVVDDLADLVEELKLTDVILLGHGIGGQAALLFAYHYPSIVSHIIITATPGLPGSSWCKDDSLEETEGYGISTGHYIDEYEVPFNADIATLVNHQKAKNKRQKSTETVPEQTVGFLNRIDHPILLIWGLDDRSTPPEVAMHFYDFLQNADVRLLEDCGHLPMAERPEIFCRHILAFLD